MKYKFSLNESDYLTHQLFVASTSKPAIWRRRRSWALTTGMFLIFAWLFYHSSNEFLTNYFIGAAIVSAVFFPLYSGWRYKKHYRKHIKEHFSKSFGKEAIVEFRDEDIFTKDEFKSESKINYSQIESFNELPEHFLIRLNSGQSLILPKEKIAEVEQLRKELSELAIKLGNEITDYTTWKWK